MELQNETGNVGSPRASSTDQTSSLADKARSDIAQAAETAKTEARRVAGLQKEAGADRLGDVAGAVHGAARSLEEGMPQVASYVHDAAVRIEGAADTLRQRNIDDLMGDVSRFARTQPVLFFGGAMLAGLALARFLKSSTPGTNNGHGTLGSSSSTSPSSTRWSSSRQETGSPL